VAPKASGVSRGASRYITVFAITAAVTGGTTGIQKFVEATPYFTFGHLLLITAPLSVSAAIIFGAWVFHKYSLNVAVALIIVVVGAVLGVLLNLSGHSQLRAALLGQTVCHQQVLFASYHVLQCQTQAPAGGITDLAWRVLHAYWTVYGVWNFLLAIGGGLVLAALVTGDISLFARAEHAEQS
jgi:hypothetical protein